MIVELVAIAFVIAGFAAIAVRFQPRDWLGERRWPRFVDTSVGMWLIRRLTGRPTESPAWDWPDAPEPSVDEIAARIGAPRPTLPTRYVVSARPHGTADRPGEPVRTGPIPPAELVARATAILEGRVEQRRIVRRRSRAPETALAAQRRLAGLAALGVVAMVTAVIGLAARNLDGAVLGATATPPPSDPAGRRVAPADGLREPDETPSPAPYAAPVP